MSDTVQDFGFRAMTRFWAQAQLAALQAQEDAAKTIAEAFNTARKTEPAAAPTDRPAAADAAAKTAPLLDMTQLTEASEAATDLWNAANDLSETLFAAAVATAGAGMAIASGSVRTIADPLGASRTAGTRGTFSGLVGQVVEGPQFADMLNGERQQARVFKAWLDLCQHRFTQNALILNAWIGAGHRFGKELAHRNRTAPRPLDGKAMLALWIETANRDLVEMQRSQPFLTVQRTVMSSGMELKVAQNAMAEGWAERFDLPTRTELDDVHRTVTELKRELRHLKRQPASSVTVVTEEPPAPRVAPAPPVAEAPKGEPARKPGPPAAAPPSEIVALPTQRVTTPAGLTPARRRRLSS